VSFFARCPGCRSRFRVPSRKRDETQPCKTCDRVFVLVPEDEPPPAVRGVSAADPLAGSGIATADPANATAASEIPAAKSTFDLPAAMALAALGLTGIAVLLGRLPYGRFATVGLAAVGTLVALVSLTGLDKRQWVAWTAVAANVVILILSLALPGWLGVGTWMPPVDPDAGEKPVTAVGRDGSLPVPTDCVDASRAAWEQGDLRVSFTSIQFGRIGVLASKEKAKPCLLIGVRLTNVGVARALEWARIDPTGPDVRLTDAAGNSIRTVGPPDQSRPAPLFPGKSVDQSFAFEIPPTPAGDLRLEFGPVVVGGTDPVRFRIPKSIIPVSPRGVP
jgi:hypothetical protein